MHWTRPTPRTITASVPSAQKGIAPLVFSLIGGAAVVAALSSPRHEAPIGSSDEEAYR